MKELNFDHNKPIYKRGSTAGSYARGRYENNKRSGMIFAVHEVKKLILKGILKSLKTNIIACFYCGSRATIYEHRDYNKPLDVVPCCKSCNHNLGPALNKI